MKNESSESGESCRINVKLPKGAKASDIESAVNQALKTKLTDVTLESCKKGGLTITVKFG